MMCPVLSDNLSWDVLHLEYFCNRIYCLKFLVHTICIVKTFLPIHTVGTCILLGTLFEYVLVHTCMHANPKIMVWTF